MVAREVEKSGGVAKEFNTIAVDDGIAMGHDGMLYSLPSREIIADSVEYMVNAHCADAMVCISNCDKITPGMLMASMRLNIPVVFVSGGPMEAGKVVLESGIEKSVDLVDAMVAAVDDEMSEADVSAYERSACPTCGSCSGMFTANSMNCLAEALGLALPGNGSMLATHSDRKELFLQAGRTVVDLCKRYYEGNDASVLPRSIASKSAFENAMSLDIAMGGSTNTILHLLAAANEGEVDFDQSDIDRLSRNVPCLCKVAPAIENVHMEDVHRAGGIMAILGEMDRAGLINTSLPTVHSATLADALNKWDVARSNDPAVHEFYRAAPGGVPTQTAFSQSSRYNELDLDRESGVIRNRETRFAGWRSCRFVWQPRRRWLRGKNCRCRRFNSGVLRPRKNFRKPRQRGECDSDRQDRERRHCADSLRRTARWSRNARNALSDELSEIQRAGQRLRPNNRRPLLRRHLWPVHRSRLARSGRRRHNRVGRGG